MCELTNANELASTSAIAPTIAVLPNIVSALNASSSPLLDVAPGVLPASPVGLSDHMGDVAILSGTGLIVGALVVWLLMRKRRR